MSSPPPDPTDPTGYRDPLGLEVERFRQLAHGLVDRVADHWAALDELPVLRTAEPAALGALGGALPQEPGEIEALLETLITVGLANMQNAAHRRYFTRVPSPASLSGVLGEWLGVGFNGIASSWAGGSGPSQLELVVIDWLRELLGFPQGTEGVLVSGGSLGNLTALAAARSAGYTGPVYISDQTHAAIPRALRLLGVPPAEVRIVPADECFHWGADALDRLSGTTERGRAIVVATAGTTNTGATDPLQELAELCAERDLWLHVDGAYGAPAALCAAGRRPLRGIEHADSLTLDPHKWLFQPYDLGCVLVRRPGVLEACYTSNPEYLRDVSSEDEGQVDLRNRGPEVSRRARAAKLWLTFRVHGARRIAEAIGDSIALAERVQGLLEADLRFEVVTPAQLGVITFAGAGLDGAEHERRARTLTASGFAAVSCTELGGRTVFRLCLINPRTTLDDVAQCLERLACPTT